MWVEASPGRRGASGGGCHPARRGRRRWRWRRRDKSIKITVQSCCPTPKRITFTFPSKQFIFRLLLFSKFQFPPNLNFDSEFSLLPTHLPISLPLPTHRPTSPRNNFNPIPNANQFLFFHFTAKFPRLPLDGAGYPFHPRPASPIVSKSIDGVGYRSRGP